MTRTYLVEAQRLFVPFLSATLERAGLEVVASGPELDLKAIAAVAPGAVFVDVDAFERGGVSALCRLRESFRDAALLAYSSSEDRTYRAACYISGATLVCSKSATAEDLLVTIRAALATGAGARREKSGSGA